MSGPTVSAIIPLYNGARFIEATLGSVAAQTYPLHEVVVVDNGSEDDGPEIVRRLGVRLERCEKRGPGAARNRGVDLTTGELIAFLDQDDRWLPEKTAAQVRTLMEHPEADYSVVPQRMFVTDLAELPIWMRPEWLGERIGAWFPGSLMVRRESFFRNGRFDEELSTASDADWFARAHSNGLKFVELDEVLVEKRVHSANQSGEVATIRAELFKVLKAKIDREKGRKS